MTWIGGPTMVIDFGPISLVTDPVLGVGSEAFRVYDPNVGKADVAQARLRPAPKLRIKKADIILLSHIHEDHFDRSAAERLGDRAEFLVPPLQVDDARKRGAVRVAAIAPGETRTVARGGYRLSITAVKGQHSPDPKFLPILGEVNGYWLEFSRGSYRRTIYWTGDSFPPVDGVADVLRRPDLFVPHLGGVGARGPIGYVSMGHAHALAFAKQVMPRAILPIHHSTFSLYREPIDPFVVAALAGSFEVKHLSEGQELILD